MPKVNFSPLTIQNLKPEARSVEYFEEGRNHGEGSFGLRISPKNKRTWFVMYKIHTGKVQRFTLGTYPKTSLKDARKLANDVMSRVHDGEDPMGEVKIRKAAPRVLDLWEAYQESLSRKVKKKGLSTVTEEHNNRGQRTERRERKMYDKCERKM